MEDKKRKFTIKEIARKAEVSVATVSRALNPDTAYLVKPETLKKIEKVTRKLQYVPNRLGQDLRKKCSRTIGLLVNFQSYTISGYLQNILEGVISKLHEIEYDLKFISGRQFFSIQNILDYSGVDGIIMTHAYQVAFPNLTKEVKQMKDKPWPVVIINDFNPEWLVSQVYVDSFKSTRALTEELIKKGYRNYFFIGGERGSVDAENRRKAFLQTLEERNIHFDSRDIANGHFTEEGGYKVAMGKLENSPDFKGVFFCINDAMALGALRAIGETGLRCPKDVAIVGYDGILMTEYSNPPISTVEIPLHDMGREAVSILYKVIIGKQDSIFRKEYPFKLKLRGTF